MKSELLYHSFCIKWFGPIPEISLYYGKPGANISLYTDPESFVRGGHFFVQLT